ncbi:MAG: hypothetical protein PWQ95_2091 [Thermococcaceae archaeon]|nr:hypothetical protein [Thermococcaceae archaeon]
MRALVKVRPHQTTLMVCKSMGDIWCEYVVEIL